MINRGILSIVVEVGVDWAVSALPPEHRVIAQNERGDGIIDLLIEGPHMPAVAENGYPLPVTLLTHARLNEVGDRIYTHSWAHAPQTTWPGRPPG